MSTESEDRLRWQSRAVLLLVIPPCSVWLALSLDQRAAQVGLAVGAVLAIVVWGARAATFAGAATGGLLLTCFCLTTPGWRSIAWALVGMLVVTLTATWIRRQLRKHDEPWPEEDEQSQGRSAAQVAANLGVAALSGLLTNTQGLQIALCVMLAALAEAAADTAASELGEILGGMPRLLTTGARVEAGTDGAVTSLGTLIGLLSALLVVSDGVGVMGLPVRIFAVALLSGCAGFFFDSLLGATLERAGRLNNDAVNFLSTLFAAALALAAAEALRWGFHLA